MDRRPTGFHLLNGTVVTPTAPFFIIGSGRCGTTLLRRLIVEKSEVVIPPENYTLGVVRGFSPVTQDEWEMFCLSVIKRMIAFSDWRAFGLDEKYAIAMLGSVPQEFRSTPNLWHAFHAIYARSIGKPKYNRWGDKTPLNVERLDHLISIFTDSRCIAMVRDVLDVAYSYGSMEILGRHGMYLDGAKRWVDANQRIRAFSQLHFEKILILKYEDLVTEPDQQIERVLRFLELPQVEGLHMGRLEASDINLNMHLRNALENIRPDLVGKGRSRLPADIAQSILTISAELRQFFDYH